MSFLDRFISSRRKPPAQPVSAGLRFALIHGETQREAVADAVNGFVADHASNIAEQPRVTFTRDGSVIVIDVKAADSDAIVRLNNDLAHRLRRNGIEWEA